MEGKCRTLPLVMTLHDDLEDNWFWTPDLGVGYIVRGMHRLLAGRGSGHHSSVSDLIWQKDVLLKVSEFAWRIFQSRLPTKDILFRIAIISHDSLLCVSGCENSESTNHLFLGCNFFCSLWHLF